MPAPTRRLMWAVRLVLYPAAILLIALWWHDHRAKASARLPEDGIALTGRTNQGVVMTGRIRDGVPSRFDLVIHYDCPTDRPELEHFAFRDRHTLGRGDRIEGALVRTGVDRFPVTYANGWTGVYSAQSDGRFDAGSWQGTLWSNMVLRYRGGPPANCHAGPVRFALRGAAR